MPGNATLLYYLKFSIVIGLLFTASVWDIRKRIVPDFLPILLTACCFIPKAEFHPSGLFIAIALLLIGTIIGGIGGGDIKMIAAYGLLRGAFETTIALTITMLLLILFHGLKCIITKNKKCNKAYPMMPFFLVGNIIGFLLCM